AGVEDHEHQQDSEKTEEDEFHQEVPFKCARHRWVRQGVWGEAFSDYRSSSNAACSGCRRPRCPYASGMATRPRGVRPRNPIRTRKGSTTLSTVSASSPTATASVLSPTGPPRKRRTSVSSTARSRRSRPIGSTSYSSSAACTSLTEAELSSPWTSA